MIFVVFAAVLGLLIGSFLNVCIARMPWEYSVVTPRSHCPQCGQFLSWFENIPVLSYVFLGGRCRHCRRPISLRYPFVELLTAGCFAWAVYGAGWTWEGFRVCLFSALLIGLIFTDLDWLILPDEFTLGGAAAGLALAAIEPLPVSLMGYFLPSASPRLASFVEALVASVLASGLLWAVGTLYMRFRGREGLGLGDVKMIALLGAFLGIQRTLSVLVLGSLAGSIFGLIWIKLRGLKASTYEIPFGSFLGAAALLVALIGPA